MSVSKGRNPLRRSVTLDRETPSSRATSSWVTPAFRRLSLRAAATVCVNSVVSRTSEFLTSSHYPGSSEKGVTVDLKSDIRHNRTMVSREGVAQKVRASIDANAVTTQSLTEELHICESELRDKLQCIVPFTLDELQTISRLLGIALSEFFSDGANSRAYERRHLDEIP